ncbi:DUF1761 domain-containing protein [Candidatus Kaiserbacteria bacterium]|nr:DUF1761 domain-containing protein [Candidatus Kaiserbacteria bacterium]
MFALFVPFVPVVAAAVAHVIVGYLWYHPRVFGRAWTRLANISPEIAERGNKHMPLFTLAAFAAALVVAYVLHMITAALGILTLGESLELATALWFGFVAPVLLGSVLWEHKPLKLYCINAGYWLASLVVMSVVLLL